MNLRLDAPVLALAAGQLLSLDDARGTRILPRDASLWVTEEGGPQDYVVGPGEAFVVTRGGLTLVQALAATRVALAATRCAANDAN